MYVFAWLRLLKCKNYGLHLIQITCTQVVQIQYVYIPVKYGFSSLFLILTIHVPILFVIAASLILWVPT